MAEIGHVLHNDETVRTTTSTTYSTNSSTIPILNTEHDASSDYFFLFYANVAGTFNINSLIRVHDGTSTLTYSDATMEAQNTNAQLTSPYMYMDRRTTPGTTVTYSLEFATGTSTNSVWIDSCRSLAIKLDDLAASDFEYNSDTTNNDDVSSASWTDGASINIGDGTSDWLVFATVHWDSVSATAGEDYMMQIDVGGSPRCWNKDERENSNEVMSKGIATVIEAPASSTTVKVQIRTTAGVADCDNTKIFALRLDAFTDHMAVYGDGDQVEHIAIDTTYNAETVSKTVSQGGTNQLDWFSMATGMAGDDAGQSALNAQTQFRADYEIASEGETLLAGTIANNDIGIRRQAADGAQGMVLFNEVPLVDDGQTLRVDLDTRTDISVTPNYAICDTAIAAFTWELATVTNETVYPFTGPWR